MLLVKLQGGLGNQMFQYAAARSILKNGDCIYLDHQFLEENSNIDNEHFTGRKYELLVFKNIKAVKAKNYQIVFVKNLSLFNRVLRIILKPSIKHILQKENEYISFEGLSAYNYVYLDGYFQSEKYFKNIREDLLKEFEFPLLDAYTETIKDKISNTPNAISLHIRRGDYLKPNVFNVHGILPLSYYNKALEALLAKYNAISIFIFSDDVAWTKANFETRNNINIEFVEPNESWKDMALMSHCQHHIIANSSFSWWGAWLSKNNGDVFAPQHWFNPSKVNYNIQDFIPANWSIVDYD